ncbi:MAG: cupin domain-containing protein [Melioribacteraceae bacterium]
MKIEVKNIFEKIPEDLSKEFIEDILIAENFRIERIISQAHTSPEGFWYDQNQNEFVLLLSGGAEILFEDNYLVKLKPGDYLIIPAHVKHRVEKTDSDKLTYWLTLYY